MYESIPKEMQQDRAWVSVLNKSKIPYISTSNMQAASPSNPDTWSLFEDAVTSVKMGLYDGIGYVFHNNGLIGIDIDAGFDEDGFINELSTDIMTHCQSYTEKSRSGRGIHVILRGSLPFSGKNNRENVEMYCDRRYFICTGKSIIYREIKENQEAVKYVTETYFPEKSLEIKGKISKDLIYRPIWQDENGKALLNPIYPPIQQGCRNVSLLSLGGQCLSAGMSVGEMIKELRRANLKACKPPLSDSEVRAIAKSVSRYAR